MSDLAALEILASINRLASEINNISHPVEVPIWKKPWVGAVTGVIVGFFLNSMKDKFIQGKQVEDKLKCIRSEVEDIKKNAAYGIACCVRFFNEFDKGGTDSISVELSTDANSYCFDKFYIDVVLELSTEQRVQLVNTYDHLAYTKNMKNRYILKAAETKLTNSSKNDYLSSLISAYSSVYHSSRNYLNNTNKAEFNVSEIIKELGIKADFIEKIEAIENASH